MSSAPRPTRSLRARLSAIWADIELGQERYLLLNRPGVRTGQRSE